MIPISRPEMGEAEAEAARRAIASGWITQGPEVAAFEREFAALVGAEHACAVSSCTAALHLALRVAGVGAGDEVITVSHSYIATANAVRYCGALPVFIDIEAEGFNLDAALIDAAVTRRTRALLCVHQLGMPCDLRRIVAAAKRHGLVVIEDAACAIGSRILHEGGWQPIGQPHGDIACFSFHPRKLVSTGDGGMLTPSRRGWDERWRRLRQHAMSVPDTTRHDAREVVFESYPELGFNYRLTDIQAAIGREQLKRLDGMVLRRRRLAAGYGELLADIDGLELPQEPAWAMSNWQSYCVRLPAGCEQRRVMQAMLDAGIATRRGVMCSHREGAYAGLSLCHSLARSEAAQDGCLMLPMYPQMSEDEQQQVADALALACRSRSTVTEAV